MFVGTFTAGGLELALENGQLNILKEGKTRKFVQQVEHRTFSGRIAYQSGRSVLYVTERAVFRLCSEGLELIEIAKGMDLERDILAQMNFKPVISPDLKLMDERIFKNEKMNLADDLLG